MTKYVWLSHSSGGNLPPSLGVASALRKRGHEVVFATKPDTIDRIEAEGFRAIDFKNAYTRVDDYPDMGPLTRVACSLTSPAVADDIKEIVAAEQPDAIMVDAMFPAALDVAPSFGVPTTVFCHTFLWRQLDAWQGIMSKLADLRAAAGFPPLPDMQALWKAQSQMIVTSVEALDDAPLPGWDHVTHVGPVLDNEASAQPTDLPWSADDATPLVLVSYTTTELGDLGKVQKALDGLTDLEAHVVVTTSMAIDPDDLTIPANAHVVRYADHNTILARAGLCVTHGGHGTMMRALKHGVPMVVIPGFPHDQAPNAALVQKLGMGIALPGDADATALKNAAGQILTEPSFKCRSEVHAKVVQNLDGASSAADAMEAIVADNVTEEIA
ncbi:MAG: nucleotide disphospho-sugar-binding domain-containing protein [Pseudomonadota bacterium]